MSTPRRADVHPLLSMERDLGGLAEQVRRLRTDSALSSVPANLARIVTERNAAKQIRVGLTNTATGNTAWLTDWF